MSKDTTVPESAANGGQGYDSWQASDSKPEVRCARPQAPECEQLDGARVKQPEIPQERL